MTDVWKVHAVSLATTLGVAYILCAIFDVLFPPFGLLAALAPASPWPISGSPLAFLTGFVSFTVAGARRTLWNRVGVLEQKAAVRCTDTKQAA